MGTSPAEMLTQRQKALATANEIRLAKSSFKRELRAMAREEAAATVAHYLETEAPILQRFRLKELLLSIPGVGDTAATRMLRSAGVAATSWVGGGVEGRQALTPRQRALLAGELTARVERLEGYRRMAA